MYTDRKKRRWPVLLAGVLTAGALVLAFWLWMGGGRSDVKEDGAQALRAAIQRSALQCYVVEGVYPPSLSYLEERYGLQINQREFYVDYIVFASNLPPDVTVVAKN